MPTFNARTSLPRASSARSDVVAALSAEASELFKALLSPSGIIAEVEEIQALRVRAERIEPQDPATAEMLRKRASRVGLH